MSGTMLGYLLAVILMGSGIYDVFENPDDYNEQFQLRKVVTNEKYIILLKKYLFLIF
jgi:hypothetical protein